MKHKMTTGQKLLIAILLITLIAAIILGLYAWAKYVTSIPGETTAKVAKWKFDLTNLDGTSLSETDPIDLSDTINFEHVKSDRIAPGTFGNFEVVVDSKGTEVSYIYDLAFTVEKCPTNLSFYSKGAKIEKTVTTDANGDKTATFTISKYVPKDKAKDGYFLETIYWDWPYETKDENGSTVVGDAQDKLDEGNNVSIKIVATGTEVLQAPSSDKKIPEVEDKVVVENVGTSENKILKFVGYEEEETGTEAELQNLNWKEFYKDNKGNTYLILEGYLPNTTKVLVDGKTESQYLISEVGLTWNDYSGQTPYFVWSEVSRADLIDKLGDIYNPKKEISDKWKYLLPKELQENENIVAAGGPTLDLWVASWNSKKDGKHTPLYTRYQKENEGSSKVEGYLISTNSDVGDTNYEQTGLDTTDKLYFPYGNAQEKNCAGYWLASPSAIGTDVVMYVYFSGRVNYHHSYNSTGIGVRPVVCIPTDIYEIKSEQN